MKITIRLTKALALLNNNEKNADVFLNSDCDMTEFIDQLDDNMPGIKAIVLDNNFNIADSINVYVNGENIRYLQGMQTVLSNGDHIGIIPAAAAG